MQQIQQQTPSYYSDLAAQARDHLATKKYFSDTAEGVIENYSFLSSQIAEMHKNARKVSSLFCIFPDVQQHMVNADRHFMYQYIGKKLSKNEDGTYIGNCGEKAFHAYCYLLKRIKPEDRLALVMVENLKTNENHTIVLLNADLNLNKQYHVKYPTFYLISNQPKDWGPRAVVYDPTFGTISDNQAPFEIAVFNDRHPGPCPDSMRNDYIRFLSTDPVLQQRCQFVVISCNFNPRLGSQLFLKELLQEKRQYFNC